MLSSVLRSEKAVHVNIEIMRTFVRLRGCFPRMPSWRANWRHWRKSTTRSSRGSSMRYESWCAPWRRTGVPSASVRGGNRALGGS